MNPFQNPAINRFADYFVICGLDICSGLELDRFSGDTLHCSPLDRPYKSKVLAHYPDNVPWNVFDHEAVSMLCLPHGLQFRTQKHSLEPRFHSFITTREDGSRTYGFSLIFFEEVTDRRICSAMQTLQAMHATEVESKRTMPMGPEGRKRPPRGGCPSSHSTRSLPRHFKLSVVQRESETVVEGALASSQVEYDASQDFLYASKSIALVCQLPFVRAAKKFLTGLYKHAVELAKQEEEEGSRGGRNSTTVSFNCDLGVFECLHLEMPLPLESYVHNLLYEVCVPQPGRSVHFWCFGEPLVLQRPSSIEEPPLFDFPLRLLFPLVGGPKRLLQLFTCLLLENQVLLYSSDYQRLMLVAESITCLLFPFAWQHVYVPILPSSLTHFLDAPVPFVMGLPGPQHPLGKAGPIASPWMGPTVCLGCRSHRTKMASEANLCFVDIDSHVIQLPEDVPLFPQQQEFTAEIYDLLAHYGVAPGDVNGQRPVAESGLTSKSCPSCHHHRHRHKHRSRRKHSWSHDSDSASSSPSHSVSSRDHEKRRSMRRTAVAAAAGEREGLAAAAQPSGGGTEASETLRRVLAIATNARVNISSLEGMLPSAATVDSNREAERALSEQEQYVEDLKFNNALREVFLNRFVHMFSAYEHFVIQPDQDMEQWLSSRESMQNFDKATFLSDQPEPHLPFLSRFIESQMFATLIDNKILSCWQEVDSNLRVFDSRIRLLRKRFGDSLVRTPSYEPCTAIKETQLLLEKRLASVDFTTPRPQASAVVHTRAREKARRHRMAAQTSQSSEGATAALAQTVISQPPFPALQSETVAKTSNRQALEDRLGSTLERLQLERTKVGESGEGCVVAVTKNATPTVAHDAWKQQCHPPFPLLDNIALNREPSRPSRERKHRGAVVSATAAAFPRGREQSGGGGSQEEGMGEGRPRMNSGGTMSSEALLKTIRQPKLSGEPSPAEIAQTNWSFVETLLKDVKTRTKRMLVEKMGSEAVELGHSTSAASLSGLEENTLMASLCDLLERIWSHGLQSKQGKSALWSHLLSFQELEDCSDTSKVAMDPNSLNPDLSSMALETDLPLPRNGKFSTLPTRGSPSLSNDNNVKGFNPSSGTRAVAKGVGDSDQPLLAPLPVSVTFDMRSVQGMSEIKTDIGYARAWVRLSLEKKLLSAHLRALLGDYALLRSLYKRYAFLRSDDEKEQFLYHLLTLNAVDYFCFTNTYTNTRIPYRVLIFPAKKGGSTVTSANAWVAAAGTLGGTTPVKIPRGNLEFIFHHKNLGILTTLRIGHDDTGPSPKWMVDYVIVRNEVTGHSYKFPCGRWLGHGVDDDSTERLLVGEMVSRRSSPEGGGGGCGGRRGAARGEGGGSREDEGADEGVERYGLRRRGSCGDCSAPAPPLPPPPPPSLLLLSPLLPQPPSPSSNHRTRPRQPTVPEVQQMLGDAVNSIVKYYYRPKQEKEGLTLLLCGELGLVHCLGQVFLHGFKSTRLFGKKLYLWDYFVKAKEELVARIVGERREGGRSRSESRSRGRDVVRQYCRLVERIGNSSRTLGKDGKFQLFICLGVREHLLHRMITPLSTSRTTLEMFEEQSFLRDPSLSMFLCQILQSLDEFEFVLENSLTKGMMDTL